MSRIDRILVSNFQMKTCRNWDIRPTLNDLTDHALSSVTIIQKGTPIQGPGRVSMHLDSLKDKEFLRCVNHLGLQTQQSIHQAALNRTEHTNPQTLWDQFSHDIMDLE